MLKGKTVLLGVTGGIAAYKIPDLARRLHMLGCNVHVLMTPNAQQFVTPLTFETLTNNKCVTDTFDRSFQYSTEHISLAKQADLVVIAPASANVIGKIACGIADNMLTTTVMACTCKRMIFPAMNHNMFHDPIVQDNIDRLQRFGYEIIDPDHGYLANGDIGDGKMPPVQTILDHILREIAAPKDMTGKKVLVTAGATCEAVDPVRYITNHSSGKMGCAIARQAMLRGAEVTLIAGNISVTPPPFVKIIRTVSAHDMFQAVKDNYSNTDIIIKAAAVADYRPAVVSSGKIKKSEGQIFIDLERTDDILKYLGEHRRDGQFLCGFSMETHNLIENSRKKLISKKADMICANSLNTAGSGFGTDTNAITMITEKDETALGLLSKEEAADKILGKILDMIQETKV